MAAKPLLVLLDAGAIIHAHRVGAWLHLCASYRIVVPAVVANEAAFFIDDQGKRVPIDLNADFASGKVTRYVADASDFAATAATLPKQLRGRIDDGELEALTYLRNVGGKDTAFVSADGAAIEATVLIGVSEVAMSLELVLQKCGLTKLLPYEHTEAFVREAKRRGGVTLVQFGLASPKKANRKP
jgi:hypothetical protein